MGDGERLSWLVRAGFGVAHGERVLTHLRLSKSTRLFDGEFVLSWRSIPVETVVGVGMKKGQVMGTEPSRSGYLPINGLSLYHEVYGDFDTAKPPLLLIPGAFMATGSMKPWADAFARERDVIVFDQQGHGRTPDTSREMSYEQFADDAAALLRALEVERADVMGYSQGGGVALQLAIRHPSLVSKLVPMSATFRKDGWYPSVFEAIGGLSADEFVGTSVEAAFKGHTPDAKAFDTYVRKMKRLNIDDQNISYEEMRSISAPTMVIVGDADGVKPEHARRDTSHRRHTVAV